MPTPDFVLALREKIGHDPLWLTGVTAVVLREGSDGRTETLLVRRTDDGSLTPVTGIIDPGEEPAVAAEREVLEEAGVVAEAEALVWVHALPPLRYDNGDQAQYLDIVFRCRYVSGEAHPADGENTETLWRGLDHLDDVSAAMRERILLAASNPAAARFER